MDIRTDRMGILLDQLESSVEFSRGRLTSLTDDEYRWEPATPSWSVRRRGAAASSRAYGPGDWVLDYDRDPQPPPVTTIAWRLGHLISQFAGRWEWTFGGRSVDPVDLVDFTPSAERALAQLWAEIDRWIADIGTLTDEQLDTPGYGQYPYGLDPQLPFIGIVWWSNREFIHHTAEAAVLRDLYATRVPTGRSAP